MDHNVDTSLSAENGYVLGRLLKAMKERGDESYVAVIEAAKAEFNQYDDHEIYGGNAGDGRYDAMIVKQQSYPKMEKFMKDLERMRWVREEIKTDQDLATWRALPQEERNCVEHTLAWFAVADCLINEKLPKIAERLPLAEFQDYLITQMRSEMVHAQSYSDMLGAYVPDRERREELMSAYTDEERYPEVKAKVDWINEGFSYNDHRLARWTLTQAITEGVMFSSSFPAMLYHRDGSMKQLKTANNFIRNEEMNHLMAHGYIYQQLPDKLSVEETQRLIREGAEIEMAFGKKTLKNPIMAFTVDELMQHVKSMANFVCSSVGVPAIYLDENGAPVLTPLDFMNTYTTGSEHANFFERLAAYTNSWQPVDFSSVF